MKRIIFIAAFFSFFAGTELFAQCPMQCWQESFPYWFCPITGGAPVVICSTNPDTVMGYIASKIHMPGCENLSQPDTMFWFQPDGPIPIPPTPPDKEEIYEGYLESCLDTPTSALAPPPWFVPYGEGDNAYNYWNNDESAFEAGLAQWNLDSSNFFNGLGWEELPGYDSLDDNAQGSVAYYFSQDYHGLFEAYDDQYDTYRTDSTSYANGTDVGYTQIWNPSQSNTDADYGRTSWLACCGFTGDATCCIVINSDTTAQHWPGHYGPPTDTTVDFPLGKTYGPGNSCTNAGSCPTPGSRYILYNTSYKFFYENDDGRIITQPGYRLHPAAPLSAFYTGTTVPSRYTGYDVYTFRQTVEHEEGHWMGLNHSDLLLPDSEQCPNNETQCFSSLAFPMVMSAYGVDADRTPIVLQPDDICMFQKLYCPGTGEDGVAAIEQPEPPEPQIFPNPTTGACTLQYQLLDRELVQVAIYDVLGNQIHAVSSGYEEEGVQTISLGTENLPSGNYVCRVRVGDVVSYINLVVQK